MDIYGKFKNEIETPINFNWKTEWDVLIGVEEFFNYSDNLVGNLNLKKFEPKYHFKKNFTGFVDSREDFFIMNDEELDLDSIFIEKGRIKYGASFDLSDSPYKKNRFFQDNFTLVKGYDSKNNDKLDHVHVISSFKIENYKINIFRSKKEEAYIYLSKNTDDWFDFLIKEDKINFLEKKVFDSLENVKDFFKEVKGNFFRDFESSGKKYSFEEALKIIR
jgi:hypothetical protein